MKNDFNVQFINGRYVCVGGVGTLFHESGFPIGMSEKQLNDRGIELSWFHVIKELYFQYTSNERLFTKIQSEIEDSSVEDINVDIEQIRLFINSGYEQQQEMIFQYLFGLPSSEAIIHYKEFAKKHGAIITQQ